MKSYFKKKIYFFLLGLLYKILPNLRGLENGPIYWEIIKKSALLSDISSKALLYGPYNISNSTINDYTYVALNSIINNTTIGKFCSIGPNLICGFGVHPTNGISTSPMFYSIYKQNGISLSKTNKIDETPPITIGNDVFIGANVTILNGVTIGDGAVIGAGSVVSKNIPPYAIAVGAPIKIIRFRFEKEIIESLLSMEWWNKDINHLERIEEYFFDVQKYINECK